MSQPDMNRVGAVCIGRNEGERLRACLEALVDHVQTVVYVDSNSTDDSVQMARQKGAEVIELDMSVPFTAARARNAGYRKLREVQPDVALVQFVDGDCAVADGWLDAALAKMDEDDRIAAVTGRRIERYPEASVYNLLCDLEWRWNVGYGEVTYFGGDALVRAAAFDEVDGLDETLIAGEEPEFCFRLRKAGWKIVRIDQDMTLHDAAMTRFSQWWKRAERAGHASAEAAWMHGKSGERFGVRPTLSTWIWALGVPAAALGLTIAFGPWGLLTLAIYPVQWIRMAAGYRKKGMSTRNAIVYSLNCIGAKFPNLRGQCTFIWKRLRGRQSTLIEYK